MTVEVNLEEKVSLVSDEYQASSKPWVIGFSGGKDSSLVLKILFEALLGLRRHQTPVSVVYCDTGVEIPIVASFVRRTLRSLELEAKARDLPIRCHIARPLITDTFFVRVIGRGYAPPTNKFRWCTDKLRILPVQRLINNISADEKIVVLGVRNDESQERKRVLNRHRTDAAYFYRQSSSPNRLLFCPIVDLDTLTVWEGLYALKEPRAIDVFELGLLYKQAGGECPIIREVQGAPCGHGRFGCWTCTVVRQDRAVRGLVEQGHNNLAPLLEFRNWLIGIRDDTRYRCTVRRNGVEGLGPFRLAARRLILRRLLEAERRSGLQLIDKREIEEIRSLWSKDLNSLFYREDLPSNKRKQATQKPRA